MYMLATLSGEIIEQMFHVSRLKRGLVKTPTGKRVANICDFKSKCAKAKADITHPQI